MPLKQFLIFFTKNISINVSKRLSVLNPGALFWLQFSLIGLEQDLFQSGSQENFLRRQCRKSTSWNMEKMLSRSIVTQSGWVTEFFSMMICWQPVELVLLPVNLWNSSV